MTETPPQQDSGTGPTGFDRDALHDIDRLRRSTTDRKIAGVAGGLGRHFNIDPTILRVLFVVLVFFGGAGLLLYGAAWLLLPEDGSDEAPINTSPSTRTTALIVAGVIGVLLVLGDSWGGFGFPWPLAIVALVVVLILMNKDRPSSPSSSGTDPQSSPGGSTTPGVGWPQADASAGTVGTMGTTGTTVHGWVGDTTSERAAEETGPGQAPPAPPYGPPSWTPAPPPRRPRPSKKDRGPALFGFTLAFIALALGVLGLYDVSGGNVVDSAYPALALTVVGVMLLWGAFSGRPGGLIFLGIVAALALAATSTAGEYGWDRRTDRLERPATAAEMPGVYRQFAGELVVDLTRVSDLENLDGRSLDIRSEFGEVVVIVPDGVDVNVDAEIGFGGQIEAGPAYDDGRNPEVTTQLDGGTDVPTMDLDIDLTGGRIEVRQEAA